MSSSAARGRGADDGPLFSPRYHSKRGRGIIGAHVGGGGPGIHGALPRNPEKKDEVRVGDRFDLFNRYEDIRQQEFHERW